MTHILLVFALVVLTPGLTLAQESTPPIDRWISDIQTGEIKARREAAYQLQRLGRDALPALPALIKALEDRDQQVWFHAMMTMAAIGPDAAPAVADLIETLQPQSGRRRRGEGGGEDQRSYRAAYALGAVGPAAIPALREVLTSENDSRRKGAARALGFMGSAAAPALPELLSLLNDNDEPLRDVAVETFAKIGPQAVDPLRQALSSEAPEARAAAAVALGEIGAPAQPAADQLAILAREDPTDLVRASAIESLRRLGYPQLLSILLDALQRVNETDQQAAVDGLLLLRPADEITVPALIPLLQGEPPVRQRAAYILGRIGPSASAAVPALIQEIKKSSENPLILALAEIGPAAAPALLNELSSAEPDALSGHWSYRGLREMNARALPALRATLVDSNPTLRMGALLLLAELGPGAQPAGAAVLGLVEDAEPAVRTQAIHTALALEIPLETVSAQLITLLRDPNPSVRSAAALSMSRLGDAAKPAVPVLLDLTDDPPAALVAIQTLGVVPIDDKKAVAERLAPKLDDTESPLRKATVETLGKLGPDARGAVDQLASIAKKGEEELRLVAVEALGRIGTKEVLPTLEQLMTDQNAGIRAKAARGLGELKDVAVLPMLIGALKDTESNVRRNAAESIGLLGPDAREATDPLFELIQTKQDWEAALEAARAIRVTSVPRLIESLKSDEVSIRSYACERIRALGSDAKEALPALQPLLQDDYDFVRNQARRAIRAIERD